LKLLKTGELLLSLILDLNIPNLLKIAKNNSAAAKNWRPPLTSTRGNDGSPPLARSAVQHTELRAGGQLD
jgi:hypothetical protein